MSPLSPVYLKFLEKYPKRIFSAGRTIVYQSEIPHSAYVLMSGVIRVYSLDLNGDESIITFLKEDAMIPVEFIFEKTPSSLFYYSAATEVEVAVVPVQEIRHEMKTNNDLQQLFIDALTTTYVGAQIHIQALEQSQAREKLIHILHYLVMRFGKQQKDDRWMIDLPLRQHDIANLVGVTRETAATELSKLKKNQIISYSSFFYTVDVVKLGKLVGKIAWEDIEIG